MDFPPQSPDLNPTEHVWQQTEDDKLEFNMKK